MTYVPMTGPGRVAVAELLAGVPGPADDRQVAVLASTVETARTHGAPHDPAVLPADEAGRVLLRLLEADAEIVRLRAARSAQRIGKVVTGRRSATDADELDRLRARVAELKIDARAPLTVYQAAHDSAVLGIYTTLDGAQEHCESVVRRRYPADAEPVFDWVGGKDFAASGDPLELYAELESAEQVTGCTVIPVMVSAAYRREADE